MIKKKVFLLLCICILIKQSLFSQKTYNTWFFGYHSGLDFNTDPPTPLNNPLMQADEPPYYTSTISDTAGSLLFFTNGISVWNANREEMIKVAGRWPWQTNDYVLPLICPYSGNDSLYYLFTVGKGSSNNAGKLVFVTINMAANSNTGEIFYPQPSTDDNYFTVLTEKAAFMLAGTAHCNQKDTWIVTVANGKLKNFLVSSAGINSVFVTTTLPTAQPVLDDGYGNIKFSANGEKLVIPIVSKNEILVYDFNNQTGVFSNPVLLRLPSTELLQDVELSPSGTKLYYASYELQKDGADFTGVELHNIYQYNLEVGSATDIEKSRYTMNSFPDRGGCSKNCYIIHRTLQLGPDGKIYISQRDVPGLPLDKKINVIEYPDKNKEDAYYRRNYLDAENVYKFINVSYIRSGSFSLKENGIRANKKICLGLPTEFSLLYRRIDSVKWNFGDPASGILNYSTAIAPSHNYASVGQYTIKAIIYTFCNIDTAVTQVSIDSDPIVLIPVYIKDTMICIGNKLSVDAATPSATTYQWSDGLIYSYREIDKPGSFLVRAYNACSSDQKKFTVKFEGCPCEVFTPSAFTPNNDGLNDYFRPITKCAAKNYLFKVFNRYGNIVFTTNELNKGWDGKYKSFFLSSGVFVWILQYRNPNNNLIIRKQGTVTLIR
jgi:gliding motility-associated-like protein